MADTVDDNGQNTTDADDSASDDNLLLGDVGDDADDTSGDDKSTDDKDGDDAGDDKDKDGDNADSDKDLGAPEKYEDFTMPEGVVVNEQLMTSFQEVAKKHNLSQEAAQEIIDVQTKSLLAEMEARETAFHETVEDWRKEVKADKDIGGDKLDENLGLAKKALDTFGSDELRDTLKVTGLNNHLEFIRLLVKVGNAISEDKFKPGGGSEDGGAKTRVERFYGPKKDN